MQGQLTPTSRAPFWADALVGLLLVLPWVNPWAPGPLSNTVPLLLSGASLALLLACARLPSATELARAWAWAALIGSAMGLLQYFGQAGLLHGWVFVPNHLGEAMSNLRQRNQLATLTSIGAVAVLWWHSQGLKRPQALWMLALLAMGNAATCSRTGLLQWLLLPTLLALWQWTARSRSAPWLWALVLWAWGVYLLASLALPWMLSAWFDLDIRNAWFRMATADGCGSRRILWSNVLHLIAQQPWTGWGWGELKYAHYMATYPGARFCELLGNAHNLPLHLAVTLGVPVALLVCGGLLALVWRARPWRLTRPEASLAWAVLAVITLHSLLEFPLWYGPFQLAVLWSVVLLSPSGTAERLLSWRPLRTLAIGALCVAALIGYDYQRMRQVYLPPELRVSWWRDDPWTAARQTVFFGSEELFAELTTIPVTAQNAAAMLRVSQAMLHNSPEPRVIQKLIESARLTGREDLAQWHQAQMQAVYGQPKP